MEEAPAIGIDLGTTYSCASVFRFGTVEIIENEQGNRTTPSVVSFSDKDIFTGEVAQGETIRNAKNTVYGELLFVFH